jgi:hypothetical protein
MNMCVDQRGDESLSQTVDSRTRLSGLSAASTSPRLNMAHRAVSDVDAELFLQRWSAL